MIREVIQSLLGQEIKQAIVFGLSCTTIRENDVSEGIVKPIKDAMRRELRKLKQNLDKQIDSKFNEVNRNL